MFLIAAPMDCGRTLVVDGVWCLACSVDETPAKRSNGDEHVPVLCVDVVVGLLVCDETVSRGLVWLCQPWVASAGIGAPFDGTTRAPEIAASDTEAVQLVDTTDSINARSVAMISPRRFVRSANSRVLRRLTGRPDG